jgi:5'-3' exonuclease
MTPGKVKGTFESKGFIGTGKEDADKFLYTQMLMGDSGDGISGIEGCGPKTAEKWLNGWIDSEAYETGQTTVEQEILNKYTEKYGMAEGISRFGETFKLVYLLKSADDMIREIGTIPDLPEVQIRESEEDKESTEITWD